MPCGSGRPEQRQRPRRCARRDDYLTLDLWTDPEIVALIKKVHIHADPKMVGDLWCGAWDKVLLRDGATLRTEELYRKGSPQEPASWEELTAKFRSLASAALEEHAMKQLIDTVANLD